MYISTTCRILHCSTGITIKDLKASAEVWGIHISVAYVVRHSAPCWSVMSSNSTLAAHVITLALLDPVQPAVSCAETRTHNISIISLHHIDFQYRRMQYTHLKPPDAEFSEQQILLGKEISTQWSIAVYYELAATDISTGFISTNATCRYSHHQDIHQCQPPPWRSR